MQDNKTESVAQIIQNHVGKKIERLLVVGCGSGIEAAILAQQLGTKVVGIDIVEKFDDDCSAYATLQLDDAMNLSFDDGSFDFVYSYHALEHIPDPELALREMNRVLVDDGGYWIGTPNRLRAIGYIGSKDATLGQKISWNMADWRARLSGTFTNEMGAHAGFSSAEMRLMLSAAFSIVNEVSDLYFSSVYSRHQRLLSVLRSTRLAKIAYPSVYFMGRK